ncbi:MAG: hypothetical protein ABFD18_20860, partial [Syntrophomonas sp.]
MRPSEKESKSPSIITMVALFIIIFVIGKMWATDNASKIPESSLPVNNNIYIEPDQNLALLDLPPNAETCYYKNTQAIAPFSIHTEPDVNYFVKLVDIDTGNTALTVFVRGGQTVDIKVPLGTYEFRYATGKNWYGEDHLFGSGTTYMRAEKRLSFYRNGQQIMGHTVKLIKQIDGNLP